MNGRAETVTTPRPTATAPTRRITLAHLGQLLLLGAVFGGSFLFLRIAAPDVGPVWAAQIRISIGALILAVVAGRRTWRVARANLAAFVAVGAAFSAVPFTLVAVATLTLPVGMAAVLNAATPVFTALLGVMWLGQRLSARLVTGLVTGVIAVLVLVGWSPLALDTATIVGVLAALGAAVSYAAAGTFVRRRLSFVPGVELATGQLVAASLILLPVAIASGAPGTPSAEAVVALVAVGILSTALPWPIFYRLLAATSPTIASTVTFIVPAFAMTWGAVFLGEPVGPELLIGFGIIIVSLVLVLGLRPPIAPTWRWLPTHPTRALRVLRPLRDRPVRTSA